jgi:mRNA interferase MazF
MGRFVKGEVVVLPFPFSDLSEAKRRPALVLAPLPGVDVVALH